MLESLPGLVTELAFDFPKVRAVPCCLCLLSLAAGVCVLAFAFVFLFRELYRFVACAMIGPTLRAPCPMLSPTCTTYFPTASTCRWPPCLEVHTAFS